MHIQKTAGTTIVNVAKQFYGNENVIGHHGCYKYKNGDPIPNDKLFQPGYLQSIFGHVPFISGHFGYDFAQQFMVNRYSFTFLRNPVERVLSLYYYGKIRSPDQFRHYRLAHNLSLNEFLKLGFTEPELKHRIWNHQVCQLASGWGAATNTELSGDELLALALQHINDFNYVGFTETFDRDRDNILQIIGLSKPIESFKSNDNPGRPGYDSLPQISKKLLLDLTELDRLLYDAAWSRRSNHP